MRALAALLVIVLAVAGVAAAQTQWEVVTQQGRKAVITGVKAGRFTVEGGTLQEIGKDSRGQPVMRRENATVTFDESTTVPLKVGAGLGYQFVLPRIEDGDAIVLTVRTELPRPIKTDTGETRVVESSVRFTSADSGTNRSWRWTFRDASGDSFVPGIWTRSIFNDGRLLAATSFRVTAP